MEVLQKDWKVFRTMLPVWQERYMDALNQSYITILSGEESASEKFWTLEKRIRTDKRHSGVVAMVSRSNMHQILLELRRDHVITDEEMSEFSEEVQSVIAHFCKDYD